MSKKVTLLLGEKLKQFICILSFSIASLSLHAAPKEQWAELHSEANELTELYYNHSQKNETHEIKLSQSEIQAYNREVDALFETDTDEDLVDKN